MYLIKTVFMAELFIARLLAIALFRLSCCSVTLVCSSNQCNSYKFYLHFKYTTLRGNLWFLTVFTMTLQEQQWYFFSENTQKYTI